MILAFLAPAATFPIGGVTTIFELASAMARRGHDVHIHHFQVWDDTLTSVDDITWFTFPEGVTHHFSRRAGVAAGAEVLEFPDQERATTDDAGKADVFFGYSSEADATDELGLPVVLIQGYKMLAPKAEHAAFVAPCPKVCIASWLLDIAHEQHGVPRNELVHVPNGLRHEKYRLLAPVEGRPPRVTFLYSSHLQKNAALAVEVLEEVRRQVPEVEVVAFGSEDPAQGLPGWITFHRDPSQATLVEEIYNRSRIFLCTSDVEGFGLPAIEAMACGAALVTTDNGGCHDYALPGRTALVAPPGDAAGLTAHVVSLLRDEPRRVELARAGLEYVQRFDWDRSGELLEAFVEAYVDDPAAFGRRPPAPR